MPQCNIFIITGPLVSVATKYLLEFDLDIKDQTNICFVFSKNRQNFRLPNCEEYFYRTSKRREYLAAMYEFKKEIIKIESKHHYINVFIANPAHYATNYVFFTMDVKNRFLLPEGIANYYNAWVTNRAWRLMKMKYIVGRLIGLPFMPYRGHISAYDTIKYDAVYTFNEKDMVTKGAETRQIKLPEIHHKNESRAVRVAVFLDQDIEGMLRGINVKTLRNKLKAYLINSNFDLVYYKKHPSQNKGSISEINNLGINVREIEFNGAIEEMIHEISPAEVVSFVSSALTTISDIYPNIRCTSIGFDLIVKNGMHADLYQYFLKKNIRFV